MGDKDPVDFPRIAPRGILSDKTLLFVTDKGTKLGSGASGALYGYFVPNIYPNNQKVAVKFTRNDDHHFQKKDVQKELDPTQIYEASILSSLSHPNIPPLIDLFLFEGGMGLVLPWYYGSLKKLLTDNKRDIPHNILLPIIFHIIKGIRYLHHNHWVHADLKPENILLDEHTSGKKKTYTGIVADFGFAKQSEECLLENWGRPEGYTPRYAAPEVLIKLSQDKPADIWSIGCIIFELYYRGYLFSPPYPKDPEFKNKMDRKKGHKDGVKLRKYVQLVDVYNALGLPETNWYKGTLAKRYKESVEIYHKYKTASFEYKDHENDFNGESIEDRYKALKKELIRNKVPNKNEIIDIISKCIVMDPEKRSNIDELYEHPLFDELRNKKGDNNRETLTCLETSIEKSFETDLMTRDIETGIFLNRAITKLSEFDANNISDTFNNYTLVDILLVQNPNSVYLHNFKLGKDVTGALRYRKYSVDQNIDGLNALLTSTNARLYSYNSFDILRYILNSEQIPEDNFSLLLLLHISSVTLRYECVYIACAAWILGSKKRRTDRKKELYSLIDEDDVTNKIEEILTELVEEYNKKRFTFQISLLFKKITGKEIEELLKETGLIENGGDNDEQTQDDDIIDEQEEGDQLSEGGNEPSDED